ncbi:MAG: YicC family protein [Rhodanobacteraceae bacterium]|nr:YicC family protein [Rhodanobacteraceae bacterium]MBP9154286.1 YicC family protein [Xanthomonadales bacterium]HQW81669.1 YicC family protein [Pseudomonadota bacterium]
MIRSMTAYASAEGPSARGRLVFELRSVNHRFLEIGFRLPEEFRALEPKLRERIEKRVSRGKVDVSMRFRAVATADALSLNTTLVENLRQVEQRLLLAFPESRPPSRMEVLAFPGVINEPEVDNAALTEEALSLFDVALDDFIATRSREGERLKTALVERLDGIAAIVVQVRQWLPDIRAGLRQKFEARIAELKQPLDPGRLEQELVLAFHKLDVDEEIDRLGVHIAEVRSRLDSPEPIGRRLDFLMQEFNRESNTLGSKSIDTRTTQSSVELKVLIEQLREQAQNIE